MCTVEKMKTATCQISFNPIVSKNYLADVDKVLAIIRDSGLQNEVGWLSTVVSGEKTALLRLITDIFEAMEEECGFTMDIKISNLCGCYTL